MAEEKKHLRARYDQASEFETNNPVLKAGEIGVESDTRKAKIGDGSTAWNDLEYMVNEAAALTPGKSSDNLAQYEEVDGEDRLDMPHLPRVDGKSLAGRGLTESGGQYETQPHIVPFDADEPGEDEYEADLGGDIADGEVVVVDIPDANTTDSPTLENTGGDPGASNIVTTQGAAFVDMLEARPHRLKWDDGNSEWVVLDPAGGVVERGSNSDGEYVRWADGTQVCWEQSRTISGLTGLHAKEETVDFPASFSGSVSIDVVCSLDMERDNWDTNDDRLSWVGSRNIGEKGFEFAIFHNNEDDFGGDEGVFRWSARGNWK